MKLAVPDDPAAALEKVVEACKSHDGSGRLQLEIEYRGKTLSPEQFFDLDELPEAPLVAYVKHVIAEHAQNGTHTWYDQENPAGSYAAFALARRDVEHIPLYIEFLKTNDLNHEVHQLAQIDAIFDAHGVTERTLPLLIARLFLPAQHGIEQFESVYEHCDVDAWLRADPKRLDRLVEEIVEYGYEPWAEEIGGASAFTAVMFKREDEDEADLWAHYGTEAIQTALEDDLLADLEPKLRAAFLTRLSEGIDAEAIEELEAEIAEEEDDLDLTDAADLDDD